MQLKNAAKKVVLAGVPNGGGTQPGMPQFRITLFGLPFRSFEGFVDVFEVFANN